MAEKSKILIIGGTGYIGKLVVEAGANSGHPTFALLRESTISDPAKAQLVEGFRISGVTILTGDLNDYESLVKAIKQVDVVISTVGFMFLPSEFGNDVDHCRAVDPVNSTFQLKVQIHRAIEAEGISYTYVVANAFNGYKLPNLAQIGPSTPPRDKVIFPGDGNVKAVFNSEQHIAAYTIKAADGPRTLNKILYIKPPKNIYSLNEIAALWEKKIGKTLEKVYVPEEQLFKQIPESPLPVNLMLSVYHSVFVKGDQTYFEIDPTVGVEASALYPDVKYTTQEEYLDRFV